MIHVITGPVNIWSEAVPPSYHCDHQFSPLTVKPKHFPLIYDLCDTMILLMYMPSWAWQQIAPPSPISLNHNEARVVFQNFSIAFITVSRTGIPWYQCSLYTAFPHILRAWESSAVVVYLHKVSMPSSSRIVLTHHRFLLFPLKGCAPIRDCFWSAPPSPEGPESSMATIVLLPG